MKDALSDAVGDRLSDATLDKVIRNAASSWTQSGHLRGRGRKTRQRVEATPAGAAYALLLGFAVGRRGRLLFQTPWVSVLDGSPDEIIDVSVAAKRLGLLDLKQSGSMIDVSFPTLFTERERELIYGRIDRLADRYKSYIALPWQKDLAGAQRAIFIVYDKADERRLRARKDLFALATAEAGHGWKECDLTRAFAEWMAKTEYRDSYFESPEDIELKLEISATGSPASRTE